MVRQVVPTGRSQWIAACVPHLAVLDAVHASFHAATQPGGALTRRRTVRRLAQPAADARLPATHSAAAAPLPAHLARRASRAGQPPPAGVHWGAGHGPARVRRRVPGGPSVAHLPSHGHGRPVHRQQACRWACTATPRRRRPLRPSYVPLCPPRMLACSCKGDERGRSRRCAKHATPVCRPGAALPALRLLLPCIPRPRPTHRHAARSNTRARACRPLHRRARWQHRLCAHVRPELPTAGALSGGGPRAGYERRVSRGTLNLKP